MELREAARCIAAKERGTSAADVTMDESKSVYVSLYQTHIPKLVKHDVVRYDRDEKTVSLISSATTRRLVEMLDGDHDRPGARYYAMIGLVGIGLLAAAALTGTDVTAWRMLSVVVGVTVAAVAATGGRSDRTIEVRLPWKRVTRR